MTISFMLRAVTWRLFKKMFTVSLMYGAQLYFALLFKWEKSFKALILTTYHHP